MPKKAGIIFVTIGVVLIFSALLLFLYNGLEDRRAGQQAESLMDEIHSAMTEETDPTTKPTEIETEIGIEITEPTETLPAEMPVVMIDGYEGHVFDSGNSEDWVMPIATHYALEYIGVVNELLKIMAEAKDYSDVIKYAAQSMEIEPGNMRAHYWRIFALYQSGATEMAKASLPMARRNLTEEEYDDLIDLLRTMQLRYPPEKGYHGGFLP